MKNKLLFLLSLILVSNGLLTAQNIRKSLNGQWDLIDPLKKEYSLTCDIPGTVFEALQTQKLIDDPFYGTNELKMKGIYGRDWVFSREILISSDQLKSSKLFLTFDGIDTIGEIRIDGSKIIDIANMHRQYKIDLKAVGIEAGKHLLEVEIKSPSQCALDAYDENKVSLMNTNHCGIPGAPYTRKAWYSYGWDWGTSIPDSGIWKDVYLEQIDDAEIESVQFISNISFIKINPNDKWGKAVSAEMQVITETQHYTDSELSIEILFEGHGTSIRKTMAITNQLSTVNFKVEDPKLWWIYELGTPNLYNLTVNLVNDGTIIESNRQKVGIRKVELVRNPDKWGETFYFKLNGIPVFSKGANWIPVDTFIPRGIKAGLVEKRIQDAKAANFNMIRVWGGGIYETERFYNACDEEGLMVWQDFAFACYATPDIEEYYDNVKIEAVQNVKRLRNRASLVIWVGNNEIEVAWRNWGYLLMFPGHKDGYDKMFNQLLPSITKELDPTRSYWPSSPHSGESVSNPDSPDYGDSHYWAVWHGGLPFSAYRKYPSRFMSEFGFESFPDMKTIEEFCPEDQYQFDSEIMENHQKNGAGNRKIMSYMKKRFSVPKTFEKQVIVSQLTQAEAMEYGIDYWRKQRKDFQSMGSLFWQFNDTWPAASWSSVDYYGRWKALHYFAKRFFSPVYCSIMESSKKAELWIVNDLKEDQSLTLNWSLQRADGTIFSKGSKEIMAEACNSALMENLNLKQARKGKGKKDLILFWELLDTDQNIKSRGFKLFNKPKTFPIQNADFNVEIQEINNLTYKVKITASENALYTYFQTSFDFKASDNFFHLEKKIPYEVIIDLEKEMTLEEFRNGITIESYYELTKE